MKKKLICWHKWQTIDTYRFSQYGQDGLKYECLSETQECEKCGKRRNKFISIPHGFEKQGIFG